MIYVNGDGFAAASYSAAPYSFAGQDLKYRLRGQIPHPANFDASFGLTLSNVFHQNLTLDAYEFKSIERIMRETNEAVDRNKINYLVLTFPNFFGGETLINGKMVQFKFSQVRDPATSKELKEAIQRYTEKWDLDIWMPQWLSQLNDLSAKLIAKNVKFAFVMSDSVIKYDIPYHQPKWLMDPRKETITSWAGPKELLNGAGYLSPQGQTELAKLLINYLTSQ